MSVIKQKRAAQQLQLVLSALLRDIIDDPRLSGVTVTEVRMDRELEHATVFVAALAGDERRADVLAGLASAHGLLRRELAARLPVRRIPVMHFYWDAGLAHGEHMAQVLDGLRTEPPVPAPAEPTQPEGGAGDDEHAE